MGNPPRAAAVPKPCCVCDAPDGKHCTKCKSRHYCGKACQLVDWKRGHSKACKQLAFEFQDRLLDELMPEKLKIKEEPAIVDNVAPAAGSRAAPRAPAARTTTTAVVKASALNDDTPEWRGTCAICLDVLPVDCENRTFYECCCMTICSACSSKCYQHDRRCPLCRAPGSTSAVELVRRLQEHVDKGNALAQTQLGDAYREGSYGLKKSPKRGAQLYELAAAHGHAIPQFKMGRCYEIGEGVKIDYEAAALWYQRAAEQGYPFAQYNLGAAFDRGQGVAQSDEEAVKWYRLAAAQGDAHALFNLGACHGNGQGVPQDLDEALRCFKRAAAKEYPGAAAAAEGLRLLAAEHGR